MDKLEKGARIYFMGIAGTGMAAVAGLMQEAGYKVCGSDNEVYPPMSTMLEDLQIPFKTPYAKENLNKDNVDIVVVANCLSRGHVELEHMLSENIPYTSFPEILGECFLNNRTSLVVTGTHGKTTTTSILTHLLTELGEDPSYMIGGIPRNFNKSFHLGSGSCFVIEGDEYDTAWFDKESKFLHYKPNYLLFNNLEFDHADIFKSLADIEKMFSKFLDLATSPKRIIANIDDSGVANLLQKKGLKDHITSVSMQDENADVFLGRAKITANELGQQNCEFSVTTKQFGEFVIKSKLVGSHNMANIGQAIGCLASMAQQEEFHKQITGTNIANAMESFKGVCRRFDHISSINGIDIFEDFAHHPTAVGKVIETFRKTYPTRRLVVAFEPKNATSRRNVFEAAYAEKLSGADEVLIGKCPVDIRIPKNERMNVNNIQSGIKTTAKVFTENEQLLEHLIETLKSGDSVVFMSSASFSGIQHKLPSALQAKNATA
ncbi:MAG: Mur ligase family protein [Bdellovibrionota bacterium]